MHCISGRAYYKRTLRARDSRDAAISLEPRVYNGVRVVRIVLAGSAFPAVRGRRGRRRPAGVRVFDVPLRQVEASRRAARPRADTAVRPPDRRHHGPHAPRPTSARVLRPVRRTTVFRDLRGAQTVAGATRPRAGARHHGR